MSIHTVEIVSAAALAVWALSVLLQLVDVVTGHLVRRAGRTAGTRDRDRVLAWTVTWCSVVFVLVVLGIVFSARLLVEASGYPWGSLLLVALVAVSGITALLAARAIRRPHSGYLALRNELHSQAGSRLSKGRLADYRGWLATIDSRQKDLKRRVVSGRGVRVLPVLLAVTVFSASLWLVVVDGRTPLLAVFAFLPIVVSVWLAVWGARISLARNLAIHAVDQKQRAEALVLLEDLDRRAPKKVTGLSERVSRALAILREQQGQAERPH